MGWRSCSWCSSSSEPNATIVDIAATSIMIIITMITMTILPTTIIGVECQTTTMLTPNISDPTLLLWFRASANIVTTNGNGGAVDGDTIISWTSVATARSITLTQTTLSVRPVYIANGTGGRPMIRFYDDYMYSALSPESTSAVSTYIALFNPTLGCAVNNLCAVMGLIGSDYNGLLIWYTGSTGESKLGFDYSGSSETYSKNVTNKWIIAAVVYESTRTVLYLNGTAVYTSSTGAHGGLMNRLWMGTRDVGYDRLLRGDIMVISIIQLIILKFPFNRAK
jgi:hypothetical protein